ncbi:thioredoxin family protein [Flavobacterium sp.]|uniref:thioredoxin family protein n=1 Tax=Flavobacterium sp. TaxID=239 RepID=UPI0035293819
MKNSIEKALKNSYTYSAYRKMVSQLISEGKSTGNVQSSELLQYSKLNETRTNRLDKTLLFSEEIISKLRNITKHYILVTLTEGWCGDAAQIVPVLNKMAETIPTIDLRLVLRDENEALMNLFLTNGSKSIPKVIILNAKTKEVVASWGPRPEPARKLIADYKEKKGVVDETAKIELQKWYLHDKGLSTVNELLTLLV